MTHEKDQLVDSELGKIPEGWEVRKFIDYFKIHNGFAFKSSEYKKNGVLLIRTKDFSSGSYIDPKDRIFISIDSKEKYQKFLLK